MPTRFTAHKDSKPFAPARTTFGDAMEDVRLTSIVKTYLTTDAHILRDPKLGTAVTLDFTRGFSVVVTR